MVNLGAIKFKSCTNDVRLDYIENQTSPNETLFFKNIIRSTIIYLTLKLEARTQCDTQNMA